MKRLLHDGELVEHPEYVHQVDLPWWLEKLARFLADRVYKNPDGFYQFFWNVATWANLNTIGDNLEKDLIIEAQWYKDNT